MVKTLAATTLLLALSIGQTASAAEVESTVKRVYVSNQALSIHVDSHPSGCPWGIIATEHDAAYDRWISLAMLAYKEQAPVRIEYEANCHLTSIAIGTVPELE